MIKIYKRVKEFCSGREGSLRKRLDEFEGKQRAVWEAVKQQLAWFGREGKSWLESLRFNGVLATN